MCLMQLYPVLAAVPFICSCTLCFQLYPGKTRGSDDDDDDEDDGSGSDGSVPDSDEEHTDVNDGGIYS